MRLAGWICETHLHELEELQDMGEFAELREMKEDIASLPLWCEDCKGLKEEWARERTREWAIAHRLGGME